jgi:cysteinyl-tRNA synthetase
MNFRLYNTLTKQIEDFRPGNPERITFYTCGPTVYDDAHIGNFRSFLAADLLRRWLESPLCTLPKPDGSTHSGPREVIHVMNITDVGHMTDDAEVDGAGQDKMMAAAQRIRDAKKAGKLPENASVNPDDPYAVAEFYQSRFLEDARALGLKVAIDAEAIPERMPRATGHIDGMKRVIARLLDEGAAYAAGEPGRRAVYFNVRAFENYGKLSGNTLDRLRGGAGGRVDDANQQEKRHPADFLLWKEDAGHKMKWPSPDHPALRGWGEGYPGWHIECTAMAFEVLLGPGGVGGLGVASGNADAQIDLHSGGEDNIFPHHECEIAQSCAFTHAPAFARHWFHPRFLMVDGAKMSKSKGTFFTPRELMAKGIDPAAIRLELIKTHYRANADFSLQGLKDSARTVERWRQFVARARSGPDDRKNPMQEAFQVSFADALHEDLNVAGAIGIMNAWINATVKPSLSDARLFDQFDAVLGVASIKPLEHQDTGIAVYLPGTTPSDEVETLLTERRDAKKAKDFARSDAIRDRLAGMGYAIKDMPGGRVEVGRA